MTPSVGTPIAWIAFLLVVVALLAVDLGVFHRKAHAVSVKEAFVWSVVWVALSLAFGAWIHAHWGSQSGLEFFAGYLIEKAMSVDNVFVFILIFSYFAVPPRLHHTVLFWDILGALIMRAIFILGGSFLIQSFHWILYVFGGFLIFTGVKILRQGGTEVQPERNPIVRQFQRMVPMVSGFESERFFVRQAGKLFATPLALVVLAVETTDLVFATDSIPAIFGVTRDPFIIYTSNICAILGLRAMYFLLAAVMDRFVYLGTGVGIVLMFIGAKMLAAKFYNIPVGLSLILIAGILVVSVVLSLVLSPKGKSDSSNSEPSLVRCEPEEKP